MMATMKTIKTCKNDDDDDDDDDDDGHHQVESSIGP